MRPSLAPAVVLGMSLLLLAASAYPGDQEGCLLCHRLGLRTALEGEVRHLDVQDVPGGSHEALYCSDCHPDARTIPHAASPGPSKCIGECHGATPGAAASHRGAAFGGLTETHRGTTSPRPPCLACHASGDARGARAAVDARCIACHGKEALSVREGPHWRMRKAAGSCTGCHPAHAQTASGKAPANCTGAGCHSLNTSGMRAIVDHRAPGSAWRPWLRGALFLFIAAISWGFAQTYRHSPGRSDQPGTNWLHSTEAVRRFTPHQIVQHVVAVAAWSTLTFTAVLSAAGVGGGRNAHLLAAMPAVGLLLYHVLYVGGVGIRRDVPAENIAFLPWGREWGVLRGRKAPGIGTGKYSPSEKADYLGILFWAILSALAGLALRWPSAFGVPSLASFGWIKTVHAGAGAAMTVHLLTAHARYRWFEAPPAFRKAILTGTVPLREAEQRPGWIADLVAANVLVPAPVLEMPEDQKESRSVREFLDRGNRLAKEGDYGKACEAFSEALRLLPGYSQARFNLAVALFRTGNSVAAREQLRTFIEMDPFNPMAEKAREMLEAGDGPAGASG